MFCIDYCTFRRSSLHFSCSSSTRSSGTCTSRGHCCSRYTTEVTKCSVVTVYSIHLLGFHRIKRYDLDGRRKNMVVYIEINGFLSAPEQLGTAIQQPVVLTLNLFRFHLSRLGNWEHLISCTDRGRFRCFLLFVHIFNM